MQLYHFSEEADIPFFEPRIMGSRPGEPARVWTIDAFHAPHYYLPRNCPRICIWSTADTTDADRERFFGLSAAQRVIAVESRWLDTIWRTIVYRYSFEPGPFELYDGNAGYYTTRERVRPVQVDKLDDPLQALAASGIELRVTPSLMPMKERVLTSTVNFSMIRMMHASAN